MTKSGNFLDRKSLVNLVQPTQKQIPNSTWAHWYFQISLIKSVTETCRIQTPAAELSTHPNFTIFLTQRITDTGFGYHHNPLLAMLDNTFTKVRLTFYNDNELQQVSIRNCLCHSVLGSGPIKNLHDTKKPQSSVVSSTNLWWNRNLVKWLI